MLTRGFVTFVTFVTFGTFGTFGTFAGTFARAATGAFFASEASASPQSSSPQSSSPQSSSARLFSGPFYTSECRGGVERRRLKLKGVEGGE
jgi:hypothetical protein